MCRAYVGLILPRLAAPGEYELEHIITDISRYDSKRMKVILDYGEMTFLLYLSECKKYIPEGKTTLSSHELDGIIEDVVLPRARKRVLYFLKNGDKTSCEIRKKLKEGYYPETVIVKVFEFLETNKLIDDVSFASRFVDEFKKDHSPNDMRLRLSNKGIKKAIIDEVMGSLSPSEEILACERVFRKRYPSGCQDFDESKRAIRFLKGKGFSMDAIKDIMSSSAFGE